MHSFSKWRPWIAIITACITIGGPLAVIINGFILMAQNDPLHSDVLVLFGVLVLGIVGLVGVIAYGIHCYRVGWRGLSRLQRILFSIYGVIFIIGFCVWLGFLGIIPYQWVDWIIYGRTGY
ncbi:hypothetical protein IV54_GL000326 [Levilactobacillus paucivorans]|uniref:Uncharacterized protein n=1 Tax=Levilactobacillus paucivorans TaxID=616990 RepID=A0A0R2LT74_9LACO|nr:hypothetical protein [Levilactobacillus paucivorans]KRO03420.1 hypothetical protein IV54_GL000326 [Levilactobacillus paucivorans]